MERERADAKIQVKNYLLRFIFYFAVIITGFLVAPLVFYSIHLYHLILVGFYWLLFIAIGCFIVNIMTIVIVIYMSD